MLPNKPEGENQDGALLLVALGYRLQPLTYVILFCLLHMNWQLLQTVISLQSIHQGSWILEPRLAIQGFLSHLQSAAFTYCLKHLFPLCVRVPPVITSKMFLSALLHTAFQQWFLKFTFLSGISLFWMIAEVGCLEQIWFILLNSTW